MVQGSESALVLEDREGRIVGWDEGAASLFAVDAADAVGRLADDVLPADVRARTRIAFQSVHAAGSVSVTVIARDGRRREAQLASTAVRSASGEVLAYAHALTAVGADPPPPRTPSADPHESDAWLRTALNAASVGAWRHDVDRDVFTLDARSRRQFGWEAPEATRGQVLELVHPDDRARVEAGIRASLDPAGPDHHSLEFRVVLADQEVRWLVSESLTRFDGEGAARLAVQRSGTLQDITDGKRAKALLEQKDAFLHHAGALAKVGTWEFDVASGRGVWSEEVSRIHDLDATSDASVEIGLGFFHGEARTRLGQAVADAILLAKPYDLELPLVSARNVSKWVRTIGLPVVDGGRVVRVQGVFQDITERKDAEARLRRSEAQFRQLTENIQEVFWMIYPGEPATVLYLSPAYERIWGRSCAGGVAGGLVTALESVHEDDRERMHAAFGLLAQDGTFDEEYRVVRPDGVTRWIHDRAFPVRDASGRLERVVGIAEDVTAHHEAEARRHELEEQLRQSQKMEAIGRLAGGVAHDFNNMLNVILGHANLGLRRTDQPERLATSLREILAAAQRSRDLTRQLLAFSRRQTIAPRVLDLNVALRDIESLLRRLIGEDVALHFAAGRGLWRVSMDPTQLDQTLTNLAVNARDAMPFGGRLTIETRNVVLDDTHGPSDPDARGGEFVMIAVSDTGRGMDRATLDRAFEPFFTTKPEGEGTGLGLSTVYGVARQNGGYVKLYSEPGHGTTVRVYLPRHEGAQEPRAEPATAVLRRGTETILLVEDEGALLALTEELLTELGYRVLAAEGPLEALAHAAKPEPPIDLLLTDVIMPSMNGKELSERVLALRPGLRVLFTSGYTADAIAHRGMLDPGIDFLEKPFTLDALAAKIRGALDRPA
ncbi:MAG: PAS domain-containing protein [Vicinamibacteria bacterium]